ncbi:MAG: cupin domain-containing protein [Actinomycetota bacterium]|nr:cupin domain-containing protein [Actinomycetota bacterium]
MIENRVTGERILFRKTAAETGGMLTVAEVTVARDGAVASAHVHPKQLERFHVLSGTLGVKLGRRKVTASAGDVVVIEPGTRHRFWNAGEEEARFVVEVRPSLEWEQLLATMFALAADGKTSRKGMPNPLRLAVIAQKHFDDVRLPFPPAWMQRIALALGAPLGRLAGYGATYEATGRVPLAAEAV